MSKLLMSLDDLFSTLLEGVILARSPEGRRPLSNWLFWSVVTVAVAFFVLFGCCFLASSHRH